MNLRQRINWFLGQGGPTRRAKAAAVFFEHMDDPDSDTAETVAQWLAFSQPRKATEEGTVRPVPLGTNAIGLIRQRLSLAFKPFVVRLTDGQRLLFTRRERVALGDRALVVVESGDWVRTIEDRQIAAVEDLVAPRDDSRP